MLKSSWVFLWTHCRLQMLLRVHQLRVHQLTVGVPRLSSSVYEKVNKWRRSTLFTVIWTFNVNCMFHSRIQFVIVYFDHIP